MTVRMNDKVYKSIYYAFHPSTQQRLTDVCDRYHARHYYTKMYLQSPSPVTQSSKGDRYANI